MFLFFEISYVRTNSRRRLTGVVPNRIASASSAALSHTEQSSSHHPPRARSTHARTHATSRRYSSFSIASIDHFTGARATSRFSFDDDRSRGCRARESGSRATTTRRRARRTARVRARRRASRWRGKIPTRRYDGLTETLARSLFHHLHQTTNQAQPVSSTRCRARNRCTCPCPFSPSRVSSVPVSPSDPA